MNNIFLEKIFEHNNWANQKIIEACSTLTDEQLDAEPSGATKGTIRETLTHLVHSQRGYFLLLTVPAEERINEPPTFSEIQQYADQSGEGLLAIAKEEVMPSGPKLTTRDGYYTKPWVVMTQVINHATEHREQIKSMLTALGITPPNIDSWSHAEVNNALVPMEKDL